MKIMKQSNFYFVCFCISGPGTSYKLSSIRGFGCHVALRSSCGAFNLFFIASYHILSTTKEDTELARNKQNELKEDWKGGQVRSDSNDIEEAKPWQR
jgi:hypothetical protein